MMSDFKKLVMATVFAVFMLGAVTAWIVNRGKWRARVDNLQTQVDSTDMLLEQYQVDSVARAVQDSVLDERDSVLTVDSARVALRADSLEEARLRSLRFLALQRARIAQDTLPPDVRAVLAAYDSALVTTDSARSVCEQGKANAEDRAGNCEEQKSIADSTVADLETLRVRLTSERDSALVLLKPPPLFQLTFDVSVGLGCVANQNGSACGISAQLTLLRFRLPWP